MNAYKQQRTLHKAESITTRFERITNIEPAKRIYHSFGSRDRMNKKTWENDYNSQDENDWFINYNIRFEYYRQKKDE